MSAVGVVFRKELVDAMRDRRALISMVVVPLVVMPLIIFGFGLGSVVLMERAGAERFRIMIVGAEEAPELVAFIEARENFEVVPEESDYRERIADKTLRVALRVPADFEENLRVGETPAIAILTYEGEMRSAMAAQQLEGALRELRQRVVADRLRAEGLSEDLVNPFHVSRQNVAPPEKVGGALIGGVIPYLLIILCITGAIYPAMDLTAGEKERGTIETLLTSPVSRTSIVMGKFFVVLFSAIVTALLALGALSFCFWLVVTAVGMAGEGAAIMEVRLSPAAVGAVFLLLLPVAIFFSALLLAISLFAKSFKEAQTYISPLMLVAFLPAIVGLMPGIELDFTLSLIPVLNISLVSRDILSGIYEWPYIVFIFFCSCLYAAAALGAAVWMFHREGVLFRG